MLRVFIGEIHSRQYTHTNIHLKNIYRLRTTEEQEGV